MDQSLPNAFASEATGYLRKHQLRAPQITSLPPADLAVVVVVPCYDEPDLIATLASLWDCERPARKVEVIAVVNASDEDEASVHARNRDTLARAREWAADHCDEGLRFHCLSYSDLPARHAGVGLARKLGMDEAVRRFLSINNRGGVIVALDADCQCERNYLRSIVQHFARNPRTPACSIYFEHPLTGVPEAVSAITRYELSLRYYVQALRYSGFPHAFHTVGSSMAVRVLNYVRQGGMNRRKAGEDFYFLNKLMAIDGYSEILDTAVHPAARLSHRVPFGTGAAMIRISERAALDFPYYALPVFDDLRQLFAQVVALSRSDSLDVPEPLLMFLEEQSFAKRLAEIRANVSSESAFCKRFFRWFDGFRVMKYANWASENSYPRVPVEAAAAELLQRLGEPLEAEASLEQLLQQYRALDRGGLGWERNPLSQT